MKRLPPKMIDDGGASNGQTLVYNSTTKRWTPTTPAGSGSIDGLTDVDTSTTPPSDGQSLVYNATSGLWAPATISGGGGSGGWTQQVNLPLTSTTGWTVGTGTWAADANGFHQTSTAAATNRIQYATRVPSSSFVAQVDIRADSGSGLTAGMAFREATATSGGGPRFQLNGNGTNFTAVGAEADNLTAYGSYGLLSTIPYTTWVTFRIVAAGASFDIYINGAYLVTFPLTNSTTIGPYMALANFSGACSFRNLKFWTPTLP